ncbi:MAG: sensor histidine kinase [Fluviicola sp.]|nr:sensor histidine kinase [Fluviicola sp.]
MRNLKPIYIVLGGSVITTLITFLVQLILTETIITGITEAITVSAIAGFASFITFYILVKLFITEKLKILYRSIRKGKFTNDDNKNFSLQEDVIEMAEIETKKWSEERTEEISMLKEQEEFRREFLGNLAHELKTPVFSIQGYILTLLDGGLEDESVNRLFLEKASKATERMTMILDDLDKITKMEADRINLDFKVFDMKELVTDVFGSLEIMAKEKNISLKFAKDFDPVFVRADKNKINQVIFNLLNNSISYGNENGTTEVRFYIMNDIVTVEISDDGIGMDPEELPRLFERFYRVEKSRNRTDGGSGLGLSIVKHIIELHKQTISVRSTVGIGSTFTFSLDKGRK